MFRVWCLGTGSDFTFALQTYQYHEKYQSGVAVLNVKLFIMHCLQGCLKLQCVMRGWLGWQQMHFCMLHG